MCLCYYFHPVSVLDPLHDYPTLVRLSELPVDNTWFEIGVQLGLSPEELSTIIERKNETTQDRKISMFRAARIKLSDLRYDILVKALFLVGEKELSREICTEKGLLLVTCIFYLFLSLSCIAFLY